MPYANQKDEIRNRQKHKDEISVSYMIRLLRSRKEWNGVLTPELQAKIRSEIKEFRTKKEKIAQIGRREWENARLREYRRENPKRFKQYAKNRRPASEESKQKRSDYQKVKIEALTDEYVRRLVARPSREFIMPLECVPMELIEAKREQIKINRFIKELRNEKP